MKTVNPVKNGELVGKLSSAALKGGVLVARFGLTIFLAKYMSLGEFGIYGILLAITSATPALLGFGINYFLNRKIPEFSADEAILYSRDRLIVSASLSALFSIFICLLLILIFKNDLAGVFLLIGILIMESIATDFYYSLLSTGRVLFANYLIFLRSAAWIGPFVFFGLFYKHSVTLENLLIFWFAGNLLCFATIIFVLRRVRYVSLANSSGNIIRILANEKWGRVYLSDLALVVIAYSDRFIFGLVLTMADLGIYIFYFTLANSVYLLLSATVTQHSLSQFLRSRADRSYSQMNVAVKSGMKHATVFGIIYTVPIYFSVLHLLKFFGKPELESKELLFILLLLSSILRTFSDIYNQGIYALGADKLWAYTNIAGAVISVILCIPMAYYFSTNGVAVAMLFVTTIVLLFRRCVFERKSLFPDDWKY